MLPRRQYLEKLIRKKDNGRVKVITGLRRSGKSVLLFQLYREYLVNQGVPKEQIIGLALDILVNVKYRNPIELDKHIREQITDISKRYYVFIDEIQFVSEIQNPYVDDPEARITFIDAVLGLMQLPNADIYVTGSNSKCFPQIFLHSSVTVQMRLEYIHFPLPSSMRHMKGINAVHGRITTLMAECLLLCLLTLMRRKADICGIFLNELTLRIF